MNLKNIFLMLAVTVALNMVLTGCSGRTTTLTGQNNGNGDTNTGQQKPGPVEVDKVEQIQPLILQKPTLDDSKFANVMELDLTKNDQAWFSFAFTPSLDGKLYVSLAQVKLTLDCAKSEERKIAREIIWQEVVDSKRIPRKAFTPSITEYDFAAGKTYILSYILKNLKKDFADCKAATLKFATFPQKY